MVQETLPSSDAMASPTVRKEFTAKYPWRTMALGTSFLVLHSDMSKKTIYPFAFKMGKKLGKKFKVVDWPNANPPCYEVGLVQDGLEVKEKKATPKNIFDVMEKKD